MESLYVLLQKSMINMIQPFFETPKTDEEKVSFSYPLDSHELSNYFDERIAVYYENFSEPYQDNHKVQLKFIADKLKDS